MNQTEVSFDEIYEELFPSVYRFVCLRIPSSEIEDVTSEVMAKVWRSLAGFEGRSSLKCWALKIASNYIADFYRGRKQVNMIPITEEIQDANNSRDYGEDLGTVLSVSNTLSQLTEHQIAVIQLRLIDGFSASETATILGTTQQAVDSLLYRAKKSFRTAYQAEVAGGEC
ncbi:MULTISPECIES: RNA polymerase sigma factor [Dehalobacter]|jgi:RNA polymerase sigma-70 factor (ECF subfamily)|uniref:Sigma-70 family RNA polymerase sigma factor n=2 Tax=Dehalobacter restrictus TaxID=55583 RepID=A0A857DJC1_9FIRM|nr:MULTISPECIES: RNA polymerase sigma factor [Dehalobacter]AHF09875.1 RNA polymerase subunit sigma-24 [Dehalobacter restrictus DSM 9455]MCG1026164.1 RNA polymerase sigma factor [Dehalobacter sp.]OCZ53496.1 RNA polymerase subunit sigma-24 [Dehalobacter sp. TeCB1]QHA00455.1 sigma-70 family RNA polymerase sigma factor [Dehalobacter restrictus]